MLTIIDDEQRWRCAVGALRITTAWLPQRRCLASAMLRHRQPRRSILDLRGSLSELLLEPHKRQYRWRGC